MPAFTTAPARFSGSRTNRQMMSAPPAIQASARVAPPRTRAAVEGLEGRTLLTSVFVATNQNNTMDPSQPANRVVMYDRAADGSLTLVNTFDTGGQGSGPAVRFAGDGLGSANSVRLTQNRRFLLVTNAGSDDVSVFRVSKTGLTLTDREATGDFPNSVTNRGNNVFVLNSAGQGSISGYRLSRQGQLTPIDGSTRALDANQAANRPDVLFNPTQVSFTPSGRQLVVTIKDGPPAGAPVPMFTAPTGPGRVLVFGVDRKGMPSPTFGRTDLENDGPFGFSFDRRGNLITTLFVGAPMGSSVGSFRINRDNSLTPITRNLPNGQIDSCWIENNGRYAWSANYGSGTISSYRIGRDGSLTLLDAAAGSANQLPNPTTAPTQGATPLDLRISRDGRFLYNVLPGSGAVGAWRINRDGSLTKVGEFAGLPQSVNGDRAPTEFGPGGSPAGIEVL